MTTDARLAASRRALIAHALQVSEYPQQLDGRAAVAAAWKDVRSALAAVRRIDPAGQRSQALRAELDRRLAQLATRLDLLWRDDRRRISAECLALGVLARAAGQPVHPKAGDTPRGSAVLPGTPATR